MESEEYGWKASPGIAKELNFGDVDLFDRIVCWSMSRLFVVDELRALITAAKFALNDKVFRNKHGGDGSPALDYVDVGIVCLEVLLKIVEAGWNMRRGAKT